MVDAAVLRKKIAPARGAVPGGSSASAMLRKLMPRVADKVLALDVLVGDVSFGTLSKTDLLERLTEQDLVYQLEDDAEDRGVCVVSSGTLAALTEVQMSGRVSSKPAPDRATTKMDGIVAGDIVDRWMETARKAAEADEHSDTLPMMSFTRLNRVLTKRNADLVLDPVEFQTLRIELSLGGGAKTGSLFFAVPTFLPKSNDGTSAARVHKHLAGIEAPMVAILTRMPVQMSTVKNLAVGDVIEVPVSALGDVQLEGLGGQKIATARLGQLNGSKAVRLSFHENLSGKEGAESAEGLAMLGGAGAGAAAAGPIALPEPDGAPSPEVEPAADLPELPDLPDLPDMPAGDLPALDAAPDLADLPDLPDLPELPEIGP